MPSFNSDDLHIPQKYHPQFSTPLVRGLINKFSDRDEPVTGQQLEDILNDYLRAFSNDYRMNMLEIERWANRFRQVDVTGAATGWDALVFPGATDDDATKIYGTPYRAMNALGALGYSSARIGVMHDLTTDGNTTYTEAVGFTQAGTLRTTELIGLTGGTGSINIGTVGTGGENSTDPKIRWDIGNFGWNGGGSVFFIENLRVLMTGRTAGSQVFGSGTGASQQPNLFCRNVWIAAPEFAANPMVIDLWGAENSTFENAFCALGSVSGIASQITMLDCGIIMNTTGASPLTFSFGGNTNKVTWRVRNLMVEAGNADHIFGFRCAQASVFDGIVNHDASSGGGDFTVTCRFIGTGSDTAQMYIRGAGSNGGSGNAAPNIDFTPGTFSKVVIEGLVGRITCTAASSGNFQLNCMAVGGIDIRDPRSVSGALVAHALTSTNNVRIDDCSVNLTLTVSEPAVNAAYTAVDLNNIDSGYVRMILHEEEGLGAPNAGFIPYDIDSNSSNGVLFYEGISTSGAITPGVNSSSTWLVWDHLGFSGGTSARFVLGPWYQENAVAAQTNVALNLFDGGGATARTTRLAVRAGSITGIVVRSNAARTTDTLTVEVTVNGTGTGLTAVLDGTNTTVKATTQATGLDTFVAGDQIGVRITTGATWAPTTADITIEVEVVE